MCHFYLTTQVHLIFKTGHRSLPCIMTYFFKHLQQRKQNFLNLTLASLYSGKNFLDLTLFFLHSGQKVMKVCSELEFSTQILFCFENFRSQCMVIQPQGVQNRIKGIFQPFELGAVTSLIRSAVKFCMAGHFQKKFLMIQSHERSLKPISAA